jgi:periplasmic divalent cation tolerance protein
MKTARQYRVVLVTAPDMKTARKVAKAALTSRLVACANLVPGLESHYWWQGKLERSAEVLIIFKTTRARLGVLEKCVIKNHPYDTPEFVVLGIEAGNERYLEWLERETKTPNAKLQAPIHKAATL